MSLSTFAQGNLKGTVIDEKTSPIPGAVIFLKGTDYYSVTNSEGQFNIFNIPSGNYQLIVEYVGYDAYKQAIKINTSGDSFIKVQLSDAIKLEEVIISSNVNAQAKALNAQKNNNSMVQIVSNEQIEKFPDANIGDALKRLTGVNVQYDQGEARFANIRGTAPELSSITINGERIPSAEAEKRYVQLDLIPSDMIDNIEVFKAVTPDMDADAIGGSVNLETQNAPNKQVIKGTVGSGYTVLAQKPIYKGKLSYSNRFNAGKIGLVLEGSILDKFTRSDDIEAEWDRLDDGTVYTNELQLRQYMLERLRKSFSARLDFNLNNNNNIYISGMYNHRNDWENRYRLTYKDIEYEDGVYSADLRRQTKGGSPDNKNARLEDQRMWGITLGGDHFFNKTKLDWSFSNIKASEDRPNERYIDYRAKGADIKLDLNDLKRPLATTIDATEQDLGNEYSLKEMTEEFQYTDEKDINARINLEIPILYGKNTSFLKVGTRFKIKNKIRDNKFYEFVPLEDYEDAFDTESIASGENHTYNNYMPGDQYNVGTFVSEKYLANLNLEDTSKFEGELVNAEMAGNFNASEDIYAGYLMYTQNIGERVTLIGGVRMEHTKLKYQGKIYSEDDDRLTDSKVVNDSYSNILPGLHLKISPNHNTNFRLAFTNTIARPNYYDLVPYQEINEDNEISTGNSSLVPTKSLNFDLLGEHFFSNVGILSAGIFYKSLTDVIADRIEKNFTFNDHIYDQFSQPINLADASLFGFEFGIQRRLDFLPGFLNKISLYANYTYNQSKLKDIKLEDREDETLPLAGTPKNLVNASLAYDDKNFEMRVSYSFADAFIEEFGDETFYDHWYDKVNYLDINAEYKVNKNWKIYLSLENLLNQPLRYYQGVQVRTMQEEFYGINTKFGLKFNF